MILKTIFKEVDIFSKVTFDRVIICCKLGKLYAQDALQTWYGHLEFFAMFFYLTNVLAAFMGLMKRMLRYLGYLFIIVFIDYIMV